MKKAVLRKLIELSEKTIGKEETNKIINETVDEVLEEITKDPTAKEIKIKAVKTKKGDK